MIDNYPQDRDYNALCAELREMREQKERLYYRDEALNRPDEIIKAPPKRGSCPPISTIDPDAISINDLNRYAVNSYEGKPNTTSDSSGCISVLILFFGFILLIQALRSI